jgi:hypothetical protein
MQTNGALSLHYANKKDSSDLSKLSTSWKNQSSCLSTKKQYTDVRLTKSERCKEENQI